MVKKNQSAQYTLIVSRTQLYRLIVACSVVSLMLGFSSSFYALKFSPFIFLGLLSGVKLSGRLLVMLSVFFLSAVVVQSNHTNIDWAYLFETLILPLILASSAYSLTKAGVLDIKLVAKIFVLITVVFIILQLTIPSVGFWLHGNIFYNDFVSEKKGIVVGASSSSFYMSAYMTMFLPVLFVYSQRFKHVFLSFIILLSFGSFNRGLSLAALFSFPKRIWGKTLVGVGPLLLIMVLPFVVQFVYIPMLRGYDFDRVKEYASTLSFIFSYPFGGSGFELYTEIYNPKHLPHNFIINHLISYGGDFIIVWLLLFRHCRQFPMTVNVAIGGAFVSGLYHNMSPFFLNWPFWVVYGIGLASCQNNIPRWGRKEYSLVPLKY